MSNGDERRDRIPAHPPTPHGYGTVEPQRWILMTPFMVTIGGLLAYFTGALIVVLLPSLTFRPPASYNWAPRTAEALDGRAVYLANQCWVCHSYYSRPQDTFVGQYYTYPRISEPGDYRSYYESPNIFGTERTGPDLSQEGGQHAGGWQHAHFDNPRSTTPFSIMPRFSFFSDRERKAIVSFLQGSGGKQGILRNVTQSIGNRLMLVNMGMKKAEEEFPDLVKEFQQSGEYAASGKPSDMSKWGIEWKDVWALNTFERGYWLTPDPLPVTEQNLVRGKTIYLERCSGCHGRVGAGHGPGAPFLKPSPFDFIGPAARGINASDGDFYHRILTAGKGTSMENFGTRLSVEDIWRTVLFLRTIDRGTLFKQSSVPAPAQFTPWEAPKSLLDYIKDHPISEGPGTIIGNKPFEAAAHWLTPGLGKNDKVTVGGTLPMTPARLAGLIRAEYLKAVEEAYGNAVARNEKDLPPKEEIMDTSHLVFQAP